MASAARGTPPPTEQPYDKRRLSYANTFTNPWKANTIRTMEWLTGKLTLLRLIRRFEAMGAPHGQAFWKQALEVMGIAINTPPEQIARIPAEGPLVVVANHPHGLVDGMLLAELVGRVRTDYKILTRSLLTGVQEVDQFMIPVPFLHEEDALQKNLQMRQRAMDLLNAGGVIILFPSGVVATADTPFGPAIEAEWNPFTAKMIQRSGARVVPIYFPGQNSRLYQIANRLSPTLRQGLLLYEVVHALNRPQAPVVGDVIERPDIESWSGNPRGFVTWLRSRTLSLAG
ncbi:MAG: lysophospholipid acyltransferase family protein [Pseudomonadota bacterium]|uniref:lysophospholipid acyltransferase family protein n=1 Tax=Actibacterium sp. TaxID=1872125 RepID=UPI00050E907C|nr:lysophospholipid acyltransferase family protein [Actibacterium sp.]KGB80965.1 acyltransferase [Rhodovulum sp. NI22]MDY6860650.1 lysophospholipid acyltransferase family protein [Pseudomonadota bacterium]